MPPGRITPLPHGKRPLLLVCCCGVRRKEKKENPSELFAIEKRKGSNAPR